MEYWNYLLSESHNEVIVSVVLPFAVTMGSSAEEPC